MPSHKYRLTIAEDLTVYENLDTKETLTVNTKDLAALYFNTASTKPSNALLIPVVRYVSHDQCSFIVERPPHPVNFSMLDEKGQLLQDKLYLPWSIYVVEFETSSLSKLKRLRVFTRSSSVNLGNDTLCAMPLVADQFDGRTGEADITFAKDINWSEDVTLSTGEILRNVVTSFWSQEFTFNRHTGKDVIEVLDSNIVNGIDDTTSVSEVYHSLLDRLCTWTSFESISLAPLSYKDNTGLSIRHIATEIDASKQNVVNDILSNTSSFPALVLELMKKV